jgi:hypothetical protein
VNTDIETMMNAAFGEQAAAVDLTGDSADLVFVMGPRAERSAHEPGLYARKTLHRLATRRYLADLRS